MTTEIKLGFCNPPEPIYLFVNQGEIDGKSCIWYFRDYQNEKNVPVDKKALCGYISELRLISKEFNRQDKIKLEIVINADELYVIRTGFETNFAKSFLLAASLVEDFSKALIISASAGDKNTVFCSLYDAETKAKIKREWNAIADWYGIIGSVQGKLNNNCKLKDDRDSLMRQSDQLIADLGWNEKEAKENLRKAYGKTSRSHLSDEELLNFVEELNVSRQSLPY